MASGYRFSRKADEDVQRLYLEGYDRFGPNQADHYAAGLLATVETLAAFPYLARERTEYDPPVRLHRYGAHLIVYRVDDRGVHILRVRHGREDWLADPLD